MDLGAVECRHVNGHVWSYEYTQVATMLPSTEAPVNDG